MFPRENAPQLPTAHTYTPQEIISSPRRSRPVLGTLARGQIGIFRIGVDRSESSRLRKLRLGPTAGPLNIAPEAR